MNRRYLVVEKSVDPLGLAFNTTKGRDSCGQLVSKAAERPHVCLFVMLLSSKHLWWHEAVSADLLTLLVTSCSHSGREAEVSDFDAAIGAAQDVVRLYVAMRDVLLVHFLQAKRYLVQSVPAEFLRVLDHCFCRLVSPTCT